MATLILFWFLNFSRSDDTDILSERFILMSKSKKELDSNLKAVAQLKELQYKCDFEIQTKSPPQSCQKRLKILYDLNLVKSREYKKRLRILDEICLELVESLPLKKIEPVSFGGKCQRTIDLKLREKNYVIHEQSPQNIIFSKSNR